MDNAETTPRDAEIVEKTRVYDGYLKVDRYRLRHSLHSGGTSPVLQREVMERGHAVALLLYDPVADATVMIEQFRPAPFVAGRPAWLLEIVAGIIEPGETAEEVAIREAREEAGVEVTDIFHVCDYMVTPGVCTETISLFCGRVDSNLADGIHGLPEEGEDIKVVIMPMAEVAARLEKNQMDNATSLIAIQWLMLNREKVRHRWRHA